MFRQRLLTTLVLVPLVLAVIYYANNWVFNGIVLSLLLACGSEWLSLIPLKTLWLKIIFMLALLSMVWIYAINFSYGLMLGLLIWFMVLIAILRFPQSQYYWGIPSVVAVAGLLLLPLFAESIIKIHQGHQGKSFIVYLLLLVWATDIGAYLLGKRWGVHKLIPAVSPGKTVEGGLSGFILAIGVAIIGSFYFQPESLIHWFLLAIAVTLISVLGDLSISMLKRRINIKDTGHLLPGHGGILDRLDSLIAAAPVFYMGLVFLSSGL